MAFNLDAAPFVPKEPEEPGPAIQGSSDACGADSQTGGMTGTTIWRPQYKGRIRSFSDQKGFGFIDCAETMRQFGRDVFIHRYQMTENDLKVGCDVVFEVELNKMGNPQGRRVRLNDEVQTWDSQMGGYDMSGMGQYGGAGNWGGGWEGGMDAPNYYHQTRERFPAPAHESNMGGSSGHSEKIEEMLQGCSGSSDMWELIEQYGQHFGKKHVVIALYRLGLCRQYEKRSSEVNLTTALVDRLVLFTPGELTADEASRVLWALAVLDEVSGHAQAHQFALELGKQAVKRFSEFTPAQMAGFVSSLSRLVRTPDEDQLVGKITEQFTDYALGGTGALPRFAPHELTSWTNFLKDAAAAQGQGSFMEGRMPGKGGPGGSYSGSGADGMMQGMMDMMGRPQMGKGGMPDMQMPQMGKGGPGRMDKGGFGGPGGFGGKPGMDFGDAPPGSFGGKGRYSMGGPPMGMGGFAGGPNGPGGKGKGPEMMMGRGPMNGPGGKGPQKGDGAYMMPGGGKGPGDSQGGYGMARGGPGSFMMGSNKGAPQGGPGPGQQGRGPQQFSVPGVGGVRQQPRQNGRQEGNGGM